MEIERRRNSSLTYALQNNNISLMKILLENKANPNEKDYNRGNTPIIWASENNNHEMVKILLEYKADANGYDYCNHTPLTWASKNNNYEMVKILLEYKGDINQGFNKHKLKIMSSVLEHQKIRQIKKERRAAKIQSKEKNI